MDISKLARKSVMRLIALVQKSTEWDHGPLLNELRKQVQQSVKENGLSLIWIFWMNIWKKKISKNQKGENDMPKVRKEIDKEKMEKLMVGHRKKFVRYDEGAAIYSMGKTTFRELARDAGAVYHVKGIVLVNTEIVDQYLENFRDDFLY